MLSDIKFSSVGSNPEIYNNKTEYLLSEIHYNKCLLFVILKTCKMIG